MSIIREKSVVSPAYILEHIEKHVIDFDPDNRKRSRKDKWERFLTGTDTGAHILRNVYEQNRFWGKTSTRNETEYAAVIVENIQALYRALSDNDQEAEDIHHRKRITMSDLEMQLHVFTLASCIQTVLELKVVSPFARKGDGDSF